MSIPRRRRAAAVALGLALTVLAGCGSQTSSEADASGDAETSAGSAAGSGDSGSSSSRTPATLDFTAETVAGDAFAGADLAGKPTVLWFWAPWCPTCRAQIDGVGKLAKTYGSDVNVVGVGALDEREAIEGFAEDVSPDVTLLADPDGEVWRHFEVTAQSTYVLLDGDGARIGAGYLDDAELAAMVADMAG